MSRELDGLRRALGDRYEVERELGRGGMATVYLARARERDEPVAIKVLLPDLSLALGADRFRREIAIERGLHHPHILGILDSGEAEGLLYYVMPYVAGESLRDRLDREGQLPVEEAARIAAEVAEALAYAHDQGVLHRDIKPENILLDDGRALVADFGIARAISDEAGQRLTQTGVTLGTPAYMSPEQSFAERDLDGRSDLYSLGCVLYEMLAGTPPFTGPNAQAITARHHLEEVPSITVIRPTVSDELEDLVMRALAKARADRCTTGEFGAALRAGLQAGRTTERRTVATRRTDPGRTGGRRAVDPKATRWRRALLVAAALPLLAGGWAAWRRLGDRDRLAPAEALLSTRRVAVLYFDDLSAGQRLGYLADGLTEALIEDLERVEGLEVVSRDGVLPFRGAEVARDSIGRALGAGLLVAGRVEEDAGQALVSISLLDGESGASLTPRPFTYRRPADSSLALRDSVLAEVDRYLRQQIGEVARAGARRRATASEEAWTLLQRVENARKRADAAWRAGDSAETGALLAGADSLAARAEALDPRWPEPIVARAAIAHRRAQLLAAPDAARPWLDRGLAHAERAVALDPRSADALEQRGALTYDRLRRGLARDDAEARRLVDDAERDLRAAVQIAGGQASAWVRLSEVSYRRHNIQEANYAARQAYDRDAFLTSAAEVLWRLFATSYDLNQPTDAASWCETGARRFPGEPRFTRCGILLMTMPNARPDVPAAWRLLARLDSLTPPPERPFYQRFDRMLLGAALGRAGLADSARRVLEGARADATLDPRLELAGYEAFARVVIGDHEEAVALVERYLALNPEHREGFRKINAWWWDGLKGDPRFQRVLDGAS